MTKNGERPMCSKVHIGFFAEFKAIVRKRCRNQNTKCILIHRIFGHNDD